MKLDGLMFDNVFLSPFLDMVVRLFLSVCSHIFDVTVMSVLVKGDVFEVIGRGHTKKWVVLCTDTGFC